MDGAGVGVGFVVNGFGYFIGSSQGNGISVFETAPFVHQINELLATSDVFFNVLVVVGDLLLVTYRGVVAQGKLDVHELFLQNKSQLLFLLLVTDDALVAQGIMAVKIVFDQQNPQNGQQENEQQAKELADDFFVQKGQESLFRSEGRFNPEAFPNFSDLNHFQVFLVGFV